MLAQLREFFQIFIKPSAKIQADAYLTLSHALPFYLKITLNLCEKRQLVDRESPLGQACTVAMNKLNDYYTLATNQSVSDSSMATICDPRLNLQVFEWLWPGSIGTEKRRRAKDAFHRCYNDYKHRADKIEVTLPPLYTDRNP